MEIIRIPIDELTPDPQNAKNHPDWQIEQIVASIEQFGNLDPIGVWGDQNLIVEGHGRYEALKVLGYQEAECIRLDWLTEEERRAYALAHNKLTMNSGFIPEALSLNLDCIQAIDMSLFGFKDAADWFQRDERWDDSRQEGNDEYNEFLEKFEQKKTTDDCYTPDNVYEAVANWVANEYGLDRSTFVRPFYPGGDFEAENYDGKVVVDNPPFSILAKICRFYIDHGVRFFLFAPTLTLFSADFPEICHVCTSAQITYENGAVVNTGFKTNLEKGIAVRTAPELNAVIQEADKENTQSDEALLKYDYPANVITSAKVSRWSLYGVSFKVPRAAVKRISALDAQKAKNLGIFGSGFLLSPAQAAQAAQAERAKQAALAAGVDDADINEAGQVVWKLSERELSIIDELGRSERGEKREGDL